MFLTGADCVAGTIAIGAGEVTGAEYPTTGAEATEPAVEVARLVPACTLPDVTLVACAEAPFAVWDTGGVVGEAELPLLAPGGGVEGPAAPAFAEPPLLPAPLVGIAGAGEAVGGGVAVGEGSDGATGVPKVGELQAHATLATMRPAAHTDSRATTRRRLIPAHFLSFTVCNGFASRKDRAREPTTGVSGTQAPGTGYFVVACTVADRGPARPDTLSRAAIAK